MKKIILGLAGEIAAGKGTAAQYLEKKYQARSFRFSTALRDVARRMYLEESRENLQKISTLFRENFDDNLLSKVIVEDIKKSQNRLVVIDGVRREADIAYLKQLENFYLVYIETDIEKRYQRIILRGENSDDKNKTFEEFKADHQREAELQIKGLKKIANFIWNNNGDLSSFYEQIDQLMGGFLKKENFS